MSGVVEPPKRNSLGFIVAELVFSKINLVKYYSSIAPLMAEANAEKKKELAKKLQEALFPDAEVKREEAKKEAAGILESLFAAGPVVIRSSSNGDG